MNFQLYIPGLENAFSAGRSSAQRFGDFLGNWGDRSFAFADAYKKAQGNVFDVTRNAMNQDFLGLANTERGARTTTSLMEQGPAQFRAQNQAKMYECAARGWQTPECQAIARANNMQVPPMTQTGSYDMGETDYSVVSPARSGLGLTWGG